MGLGTNGRLWAPAVKRLLAAGYDAITVDSRGCGRSSTSWRPWTTRTMAADAVAVLDELGIKRAHVFGGSLGGMVAQEFALEFPERTATLSLASTTGGLPRLDLLPRSGLLRVFEALFRSLHPAGDPERRVREWIARVAAEDFAVQCRPGDEAWTTVAATLEEPTSGRGFAMQLLASARHSSWSRLSRLTMPVQLHHGTKDPLIPFAAGRELARQITGAQFVVYPGAGHALLLERPEGAERVLAFLAECDARRVNRG